MQEDPAGKVVPLTLGQVAGSMTKALAVYAAARKTADKSILAVLLIDQPEMVWLRMSVQFS